MAMCFLKSQYLSPFAFAAGVVDQKRATVVPVPSLFYLGGRNMRRALLILLLLLSPAVHHASAAAVVASPAQEAFDSVFSADVQRVKAGRDPKAVVELNSGDTILIKKIGNEKIGIVSPDSLIAAETWSDGHV